jgi:hypothetical protein
VREQFLIGSFGQRGEAQQAGVVSGLARETRLADSLWSLAADACDFENALARIMLESADGVDSEAEHWFKQPDVRGANGELRRVHADSDAAGSGFAVVARESGLAALIEFALGGESEGMSRDDHD